MAFMQDEIERFVASLAIPADRKAVVLAELLDHVACAREAAAREGRDPDAAGRDALGNLEAMRRALEAVEPAFRITRRAALVRGVIAGAIVALMFDQALTVMSGLLGAFTAIAIAAVLAPPRMLDLLRAELRAPRVRGRLGRSVPIGPAVTYLYTVMATPHLVWIGMIVVRAFLGVTEVSVPLSCFSVLVATYGLLLVEGIRARRTVAV